MDCFCGVVLVSPKQQTPGKWAASLLFFVWGIDDFPIEGPPFCRVVVWMAVMKNYPRSFWSSFLKLVFVEALERRFPENGVHCKKQRKTHKTINTTRVHKQASSRIEYALFCLSLSLYSLTLSLPSLYLKRCWCFGGEKIRREKKMRERTRKCSKDFAQLENRSSTQQPKFQKLHDDIEQLKTVKTQRTNTRSYVFKSCVLSCSQSAVHFVHRLRSFILCCFLSLIDINIISIFKEKEKLCVSQNRCQP